MLPSSANFVFMSHEKAPAEDIFKAAREKHIFVRHFSSDRIKNYLRVTIGTDDEMKVFLEFLKEYLNGYTLN